MTTITLYTGGGVSFSPIWEEGRAESAYVRLVADEGKALKKGNAIAYSVDVLPADIENWVEIDDPEPEPEPEEVLDILLGGDTE